MKFRKHFPLPSLPLALHYSSTDGGCSLLSLLGKSSYVAGLSQLYMPFLWPNSSYIRTTIPRGEWAEDSLRDGSSSAKNFHELAQVSLLAG